MEEVYAGRTRTWTEYTVPDEAIGCGFHEAVRGVLSHHMVIRGGKIANYHPYPPTCWNASPRDSSGTPGPYEDAVQNTPLFEENGPEKFKGIDIMRTVRSFDPCLPCGVHMTWATEDAPGTPRAYGRRSARLGGTHVGRDECTTSRDRRSRRGGAERRHDQIHNPQRSSPEAILRRALDDRPRWTGCLPGGRSILLLLAGVGPWAGHEPHQSVVRGQCRFLRSSPGKGRATATRRRYRRTEARYRTLVEQLPAVTFMAALDGGDNELYVSPQIESMLGFSQKEWLEDPILWYRQLHPDDRVRWHTEFAQTCAMGKHFHAEYRFLARDGRMVWVHGEAQVVCDPQGNPSTSRVSPSTSRDASRPRKPSEGPRRTGTAGERAHGRVGPANGGVAAGDPRARADREGAAPGQCRPRRGTQAGGGGQPGQEYVPGQHEP